MEKNILDFIEKIEKEINSETNNLELISTEIVEESSLASGKRSGRPISKNVDIGIIDVIFDGPATIVEWKDGTKTIVKCHKLDKYDAEKGLAMAIIKKFYEDDEAFQGLFNKWCVERPKEVGVLFDDRTGEPFKPYRKTKKVKRPIKRSLIARKRSIVGNRRCN